MATLLLSIMSRAHADLVVYGENCLSIDPTTTYQVLDNGNNHYDVYIYGSYNPGHFSHFNIHPTSPGVVIDNLIIDVDPNSEPPGSPIAIRVLPACFNQDLFVDEITNILELRQADNFLTEVNVESELGTVSVESIGDVRVFNGDITGDIVATTPDNPLRGITAIDVQNGSILGDITAPNGSIKYINALGGGDIGAAGSPVAIECKYDVVRIQIDGDCYADINTRVNGGDGTIQQLDMNGAFYGSLMTRQVAASSYAGSVSGGDYLRMDQGLYGDVFIDESFTGTSTFMELPFGGLVGQININTDLAAGAAWDAPVYLGPENHPDRITLNAPGYTRTATEVGGGSVGFAPFDLHDESCQPRNGGNAANCDGDDYTVRLRHYGAISILGAPRRFGRASTERHGRA